MDFLSIRTTEQSVIAVAAHKRSGCPVRQPSPNIKNSIGRVALNKDGLLFAKGCDFPTAVDCRKEGLGIEFAAFLSRRGKLMGPRAARKGKAHRCTQKILVLSRSQFLDLPYKKVAESLKRGSRFVRRNACAYQRYSQCGVHYKRFMVGGTANTV